MIPCSFFRLVQLCGNPGTTEGGTRSAELRVTEKLVSRVLVVKPGLRSFGWHKHYLYQAWVQEILSKYLSVICFKLDTRPIWCSECLKQTTSQADQPRSDINTVQTTWSISTVSFYHTRITVNAKCIKWNSKKKVKRQKYWYTMVRERKRISNYCHIKVFTLKMGMIQTGLLVGFGHRPLNKFQLKGRAQRTASGHTHTRVVKVALNRRYDEKFHCWAWWEPVFAVC